MIVPFNSNFELKTRKDKLMNLITCKKSRGGGNSLKFRVGSYELGVGGSSWRFGSLFSFILSIALLFGMSGAWAVSVTYCQPEGTTPAKPIWGHEMGGILTVDDEITADPKLAFKGMTLDDLPAQGSYFSSMYGGSINDKYAPVVGMHRQTCDTDGDGHIDKIALQMGVYDGGHTKCVIVVLTNGDGGVCVRRYCQFYINKKANMHLPYYTLNKDGSISKLNYSDTSSSGWSETGNGYRLAGFKIRGTSPLVSSALAFPGKTIAELKDFAFVSSYRFGKFMGVTATNNFATFVTPWPSTGEPQKLVMQFVNLNDMKKTAIIEMTNGVGGVWVRQSRHAYNSDTMQFKVNDTTGEVNGGTKTVNTPPEYAVHGLYVLPLETVKRSPIKAFSNGNSLAPLTLDDIKDGTFSSRMCGINVNASFLAPDSALGYNKKVYKNDDGSVTNIIVEFQVRDDSYTKCVVVSFENGADGIYATALDAKYTTNAIGDEFYAENRTWNSWISNGTLSEYFGGGYGLFDLRVAVDEATEWTLDRDCTWSELRKDAILAVDEVVRISVKGDSPTLTIDENVNVSKVEFVTLSLGEHVCLAASESFAPSAVTAMSSMLIYTTGTSVCAAISGSCNVEVASGATLYIENGTDILSILNNGTVVKDVAVDVTIPFNNDSTGLTIVSNGTLKVASNTGGSGTAQTVRVTDGATFDLNGVRDVTVNVILEEGAKFANSGAAIDNNKMQTVQIILDGNATAAFSNDFGLLAPSRNDTKLDLGENTLTLDGSKKHFWLCNTEITGTGTILVSHGYLTCVTKGSKGENCTVVIDPGAALDLGANLTVANFENNSNYDVLGNSTLVVTGTFKSNTDKNIPKLTLASGATVKATGTAQTVSTTFSVSGVGDTKPSIAIDASEITAAVLREAGESGVDVLTVPATFDHSSVTWNVRNATVKDVRAKWRINEGGETKTLYIARSSGLTVIIR